MRVGIACVSVPRLLRDRPYVVLTSIEESRVDSPNVAVETSLAGNWQRANSGVPVAIRFARPVRRSSFKDARSHVPLTKAELRENKDGPWERQRSSLNQFARKTAPKFAEAICPRDDIQCRRGWSRCSWKRRYARPPFSTRGDRDSACMRRRRNWPASDDIPSS